MFSTTSPSGWRRRWRRFSSANPRNDLFRNQFFYRELTQRHNRIVFENMKRGILSPTGEFYRQLIVGARAD